MALRSVDLSHIGTKQISQEEQSAIIAIFNNPTAAQAGGVRLAGQKFLCLQASPETFLGKKQASNLSFSPFLLSC